jgi:hypothetical protein
MEGVKHHSLSGTALRCERCGLAAGSISFPGSAWERAVPRLCLVAPLAIRSAEKKLRKTILHSFAEAEPPVRVFPGGAWEQGNAHNEWLLPLAIEIFFRRQRGKP